ncbi:MAG: hypothetical protein JO255_16150, partial [Alphaproteobacteria bacterium]|nr:hypothetical protein [Alphaproteobacteria bacterium]
CGADIEGCAEPDISHVIVAEQRMHEAGYSIVRLSFAIEMNALHERRRAISDTDDRNPDSLADQTFASTPNKVRFLGQERDEFETTCG